MSNLHTLYEAYGVSPWLDNLSRDLIHSGELEKLVQSGVRGVTSNPSIFEKAFSEGTTYFEPFMELTNQGMTTEEAYWQLAIEDIQQACDILLPVYRSSAKDDGYVSLEVSPEHARSADKTIIQAKDLWSRVNRPNLMIKIPATEECLPAITEVISAGINVNVTLIFSLHRYIQVINAYMSGLEKASSPTDIRSVASFFISRVDTEIDPQLVSQPHLVGIAAVAQARAAYGIYLESFNEQAARWSSLIVRGAKPQKSLWASTSTKNPEYRDLKYVEGLLTKNSVNTMPNATIDALQDHMDFEKSKAVDVEAIESAHEQLALLGVSGIDMKVVSAKLEQEGVQKFQDAFRAMLAALEN